MVAAAGIVLGAAGLGAAIGVPLGVENRKKPKLEIKPVQWAPGGTHQLSDDIRIGAGDQ